MALIKCPECGKTISDRAVTCTDCGYPIQEWLKEQQSPAGQTPQPAPVIASPVMPPPPAETKPARRFSVKLLLIIIAGSLLLIYSFIIFSKRNIWNLGVLPERLSTMYLLHGAMLFCVLRKKIPALIMAGLYPVLAIVMTVTQFYSARISLYDAIGIIPSILLAILLIVYAIFGKYNRSSLVWMIVFLVLFLIEIIYAFLRLGLMYSIPGIIWYVLYLQYYILGFFPDRIMPEE